MTGDPRPFVSTYRLPDEEAWNAQVRTIEATGVRETVGELVRATGGGATAILRGFVGFRDRYVDLLAAIELGRRGRPVVLTDCTWQPGSRSLDRLLRVPRPPLQDVEPRLGARASRRAVAALDHPRTHYCVLSRHEERTFPGFWGVAPERVHFTAFCATSSPPRDGAAAGARAGVFAGGDSLRDYRVLVDAAPSIGAPVTVATRLAVGAVPPNVTAGPLAKAAYDEAARAAAVVVVPLLGGTLRSAGQQTYLNAMGQGIPVVVTDAPGVRDHVADGETGLVVPAGDAPALAAAVTRLLEDPGLAARLGEGARGAVRREFLVSDYYERVLAVARVAAGRA